MKLNELSNITSGFDATPALPVLFVGHGNPMNAITENEFTRGWQQVGKSLPRFQALLCVSAHWETNGTFITAMEKPRTIHDFYGFPKELFDVQYPAPGNPTLANETSRFVKRTNVGLDQNWGLDHGCWAVVKHLVPDAKIPVIEMSLDRNQPAQWHYELAKELAVLRRKGVLIIGSGNIVHNLPMMDWGSDNGFDWAAEANEKLKRLISSNEHHHLANYKALGKEIQLAVPTPEHYLPLLYVLALKEENEQATFFNDRIELGSVSMTCVKIDKT